MTVITRWWLIRHAPVVNHSGRIYGQTDVEADTGDHCAFAALARALPARPVYLVTPLKRTIQTLAALVAAQGDCSGLVNPVIEPDLMEQNFGLWQGMTHAEIQRLRGSEAHRFWLSPARERPENGESFTEVVERTGTALETLSRDHAGRDIVAVLHGGVIRAALAVALRIDPETALRFSVHNLSLTRLTHYAPSDGLPPAWGVETVNAVLPP
ncbi:MAG: histidine phosphatase family protein [Rhodospirillaceae bacterium]